MKNNYLLRIIIAILIVTSASIFAQENQPTSRRIRSVEIWSIAVSQISNTTVDSINNISQNKNFTSTKIGNFDDAMWTLRMPDITLDSIFVLLDSIKMKSPVIKYENLRNAFKIKMIFHLISNERTDTLCLGNTNDGEKYIYLNGGFYSISIYRFEYLLKLLPYDQYEIFLNGY